MSFCLVPPPLSIISDIQHFDLVPYSRVCRYTSSIFFSPPWITQTPWFMKLLQYYTELCRGGGGSSQMTAVLHRGGQKIISVCHESGEYFSCMQIYKNIFWWVCESPQSDYVIYRPPIILPHPFTDHCFEILSLVCFLCTKFLRNIK